MIFTTNKPLSEWGRVLHDEDFGGPGASCIEFWNGDASYTLTDPSGHTRHLNLDQALPSQADRLGISGTHNQVS